MQSHFSHKTIISLHTNHHIDHKEHRKSSDLKRSQTIWFSPVCSNFGMKTISFHICYIRFYATMELLPLFKSHRVIEYHMWWCWSYIDGKMTIASNCSVFNHLTRYQSIVWIPIIIISSDRHIPAPIKRFQWTRVIADRCLSFMYTNAYGIFFFLINRA